MINWDTANFPQFGGGFKKRLQRPGKTHAQAAAAMGGVIEGTEGRSAILRAAAPTATAIDPIGAVHRSIPIFTFLFRVTAMPVPTPLPDIAQHIVKAKTVRLKTAGRRSNLMPVRAVMLFPRPIKCFV